MYKNAARFGQRETRSGYSYARALGAERRTAAVKPSLPKDRSAIPRPTKRQSAFLSSFLGALDARELKGLQRALISALRRGYGRRQIAAGLTRWRPRGWQSWEVAALTGWACEVHLEQKRALMSREPDPVTPSEKKRRFRGLGARTMERTS